ncbi:stalk domain-containing protein [Anaerotignum propionicum]|uniref:stalk domain-containing protein n=1 Tax=Anaerotignum propionicum TaxID=28446 RepID=UPI0028A09323|nr:hypothetical protein [Anaerotignum propionicum]
MKKRLIKLGMVFVILFCSNCSLVQAEPLSTETIQASPTENRVILNTEGSITEIKNVAVYAINNKNYFKLRDVAMLIDFDVEWDDGTRTIMLDLSDKYNNPTDQVDKVLKKANAVPIKQNIIVNEVKLTLSGYNINGYHYFSVRDIAEIADFECTWDKDKNTMSLHKVLKENISQEDINNLNELVKEYIDDRRKQIVINDNDIRYVAKSKNYDEIESFFKNNINRDFNINDFVVEEYSPLGDVVIDTTDTGNNVIQLPLNMLDIRYYVGEYRSSYGYHVTVIHGYAKLIDYLDEWNNDFHLDNIKFPAISDEELKQKAAAYHPGNMITDYNIVRSFDMKTLSFEAYVSVNFITKDGYYVSEGHKFTL